MMPSSSFEDGSLAPLKRENMSLKVDLALAREQIAHLSRDVHSLRRRRDDLIGANNRLLARARRAELRRAGYLFAPAVTFMMIGFLLAVVLGGVR